MVEDASSNRWLWVTGPEYYAAPDGSDRADLDPGRGYDTDDWWTCDEATRAGDLALLYRSQLRRDIAYLVLVRTDAVRVDDPASE